MTLPTEIARDADLTLTWSPDLDADVVELRLGAILCNAPAADGTLSVSQRLLERIAIGDQALQLIAYRSAVQDVDGLPILFRVGDALVESVTVE